MSKSSKVKVEGDGSGEGKRQRQINWTQKETDILCELLLEHGSTGIMAKTTNACTNAKKKAEWATILIHFNSNPSVRVCACVCVQCVSVSFFPFLILIFR